MTLPDAHSRPGLREQLIAALRAELGPVFESLAEDCADVALTLIADIPAHHLPISVPDPLLAGRQPQGATTHV